MSEAHALFQLGMDLDHGPGTAHREVTTGGLCLAPVFALLYSSFGI